MVWSAGIVLLISTLAFASEVKMMLRIRVYVELWSDPLRFLYARKSKHTDCGNFSIRCVVKGLCWSDAIRTLLLTTYQAYVLSVMNGHGEPQVYFVVSPV